MTSIPITPTRRELLAASAAAGAISMLPRNASGSRTEFHPPFSVNIPRGGARRPSPAHRRDALARTGDGRGCIARRAARDDAGARALLGDRLRLAQGRGEAERPAAVHDRDRRAGHSFHPRPLEACERAAAHRHARLARLDHRAAEDHRSADQSHGAMAEARRTRSMS